MLISSETSSEDKKLLDNKKKVESSDTDYHFNLIANNNKIFNNKVNSDTSLSDIIDNSSESDNISSISSIKSNKSNHSNKSRTIDLNKSESHVNIFNLDNGKNNFTETRNNQSHQQFNNNQSYPQFNNNQSHHQFNNNNYNIPPLYNESKREYSLSEERSLKIDLLRKLSEIKAKGYELSKTYNLNSSIEEMQYEYDTLKSYADKKNGIKIFKNILTSGISLIEYFNDKYDPLDIKLSGWTDKVEEDFDSYQEVLEELYEKYKGSGSNVPPELKLMFLLCSSGVCYHLAQSEQENNSLYKKIISNPKLLSKIINMNNEKRESNFISEQELNILNQEKKLKQNQNNNNKINDVLNKLHNKTQISVNNTETETLSNNDRIISDTNISEKRRYNKKKVGIKVI
jgi:hypothetical protein